MSGFFRRAERSAYIAASSQLTDHLKYFFCFLARYLQVFRGGHLTHVTELESNSKQFGDFIEQTFSKLNLRGTAASCLVAALLKLVEVAEADSQIAAMNIFLRSLRYCPVAKTSDITMYPSSRELVQAIASSTTDNTLASTMMSALSMAITMLGPDFQALGMTSQRKRC